MLKTQKMTGSWLFGGLVGVVVYFSVVLVMMLVASLLVVNGTITNGAAEIALLPIMMVASYLSCLAAGMLSERNKLFGCVAVFGASLFVRLLLTLFTYEENLGSSIAYCVPELMGAVLALLTVARKGRKVKMKKMKKRYL